jgi:glycerol-3-phosphate O-acyltransferase
LVAFTAFQMIKSKHRKLDIFDLIRLPVEEIILPYEDFKSACKLVLDKIFELQHVGKIDIAPHLVRPLDDLIFHGMDNVGMYHAKRPLIRDKKGNVVSEDISLLYFYHNRLHGYGLEKLF